jgi:L-threonylcarbamoyladenylate synthase
MSDPTLNFETEFASGSAAGALERALAVLSNGGLVAFPTDTVYGLAADIHSAAAIEKIFTAKGRDSQKPIAVLLGSAAQLTLVAQNLPPAAQRLAEAFWPGALTLVVPRRTDLPANLSPALTIGVRMPDHPLALELLRRSGPLATTSANLSGRQDALSAQDVLDQLSGRIDLVLDGGRVAGGKPSTVVDCTGERLKMLRQGPFTLEQLEAALA